jgi:hypothetical protein
VQATHRVNIVLHRSGDRTLVNPAHDVVLRAGDRMLVLAPIDRIGALGNPLAAAARRAERLAILVCMENARDASSHDVQFLRHTMATLAYRAERGAADFPPEAHALRLGPSRARRSRDRRTPG